MSASLQADVLASLVELDVQADRATARFRFASELAVFAGHFPGYPLVPGVYLIEVVRCVCARAVAAPLALVEVKRARFTGEVRPEQDVHVELEWEGEGRISCNATIESGGQPSASVRIVLAR